MQFPLIINNTELDRIDGDRYLMLRGALHILSSAILKDNVIISNSGYRKMDYITTTILNNAWYEVKKELDLYT